MSKAKDKNRKQELIDELGELELFRSTCVKKFYERLQRTMEELEPMVKVGEEVFQAKNGLAMMLVPKTMDVVIYKKFDVKKTKCFEDDKASLAAKTAAEAGFTPSLPDRASMLVVGDLIIDIVDG